MFSGGWGVFQPNFLAGYPGIFAGVSRKAREKFEKNQFVFILGSLVSLMLASVPLTRLLLIIQVSVKGLGPLSGKKRHINTNFLVRLVSGRPRVFPGDFTRFVPGTDPVKTWDKSGFSPYFTQWKPCKPARDKPGAEARRAA